MFSTKKKKEPTGLDLSPILPPPLTAVQIAELATEIRTLADEAKASLERLKAIKARVELLGGKIGIHAEPITYYSGYGAGPLTTPAWQVIAEYCAKL